MKAAAFWIATAMALVLAGCVGNVNALSGNPPAVDHILLEVSDMKASIAFYHDFLGLPVESNDGHFAMLAARNMRMALWDKRWDWNWILYSLRMTTFSLAADRRR